MKKSKEQLAVRTERFWGHTLLHVDDLDTHPMKKFQDTQSAFKRANGHIEIRSLLPNPHKNELPLAQELDDKFKKLSEYIPTL